MWKEVDESVATVHLSRLTWLKPLRQLEAAGWKSPLEFGFVCKVCSVGW